MADYSEKTLSYLKVHYRELFRVAYAITGNAELAEVALIKALNTALSASEGKASMREVFMRAVADSAFSQHSHLDDDTYPLNFSCFEIAEESDDIGAWLSAQKSEIRRILFLRFGCRLGLSSISRATGISRQEAKNILTQAQANFSRALSDIPFDRAIADHARQEMLRTDVYAPDPGSILRTCEANSRPAEKSRISVSRILRTVIGVLFALVLAVMFWLFAAVTGTKPNSAAATPSPAPIEIFLQ
ncbi:MAG: sigma-70 family RNA polymerase sigma factor [Clostridiales bacterium]|nr:sigma-70 family RNA polymerase sigma factor [Clostridiales bacterium]